MVSIGKTRVWLLAILTINLTACSVQGADKDTPQYTDLNTDTGLGASIAFDSTGKRLVLGTLSTSSRASTAEVWDLSSPKAPVTTLPDANSTYSVSFSPDGNRVAAGEGDFSVRLWDVDTANTTSAVLRGHTAEVLAVVFSPDGKILASGSGTGEIRLWSVEQQGRLLNALHTNKVTSLAFSPDGKVLASGSSDGKVRIWNMADLTTPQVLNGSAESIKSVAFSTNGKRLAAAGFSGVVLIWDTHQWSANPTVLDTHPGELRKYQSDFVVNSVAFSPMADIFATGSIDGITRLWDLNSPRAPLLSLQATNSQVNSLAFSPDGRTLAVADSVKVRLWQIGDLISPVITPTR